MEQKIDQHLTCEITDLEKLSTEKFLLPPWIFQHAALISATESAQILEKDRLVNKLNYIHFMDRYVIVLLRHIKYGHGILVNVQPKPCIDNELTCHWVPDHTEFNMEDFHFQYLIIQENQSILLVPAILQELNHAGIKLQLPEKSFVLTQRQVQRFLSSGVVAELMQSGFSARGDLIDFSPVTFRIKFDVGQSTSFEWFNPDAISTVCLRRNGVIYFSESCRFIRQKQDTSWRDIVLSPTNEGINRFRTKGLRNPRRQISPPLIAIFEHPFFKKKIRREIFDISITGFSIHEKMDEGVLVPGMIIPNLSINCAGSLNMECMAQVLYRRLEGENVCCGFAILDMGILSFSHLNHILSISVDANAYISTEVDIEALWELLFDTGFIYPEKYKSIHAYREDLKETYQKLYREDSEIARHFTYENNGRMYGHLSMVKAYERAWLIHHHAARPMENKLPGFQVLKHVALFTHGISQFPSAKTDYLMCYFRPENKFPDRVFGGFARKTNSPQVCSLDLFSYMMLNIGHSRNPLPDEWLLKETSPSEMQELEYFYNHHSGGLFLKVLNKKSDSQRGESIEEISARYGVLRKWQIYSLIYKKKLSAVLIVNQSNLGINLSELLNSITIMVIDPEYVSWEALSLAINQLYPFYQIDKIPLLIYPSSYVEEHDVPCSKQYQMWILNTVYTSEFIEFTQKRFRMKYE